jgi:hypothetical protein
MKQDILNYLKEDDRFTWRKNKNLGIANLISKKYGIEREKDKRNDFITDILNSDRYWRMCMKENPELQKADYDDKEELEQKTQINLGYESGSNIKLKI